MPMDNHLGLIGDLAEGDFLLGSADNSADLEFEIRNVSATDHHVIYKTKSICYIFFLLYSYFKLKNNLT